jgi:uncharacterized repeat protein (TIGR03803 family)
MRHISTLPIWKNAASVAALVASVFLLPVPAEAQLTFTNLHSFSVFPNGANPEAPVTVGTDGNFYGTAANGGTNGGNGNGGFGSIFMTTPSGATTVLYEFTNGVDGANPQTGLVQAGDGNFYGVMQSGGTNYDGSIFRITPGGVFSNLFNFDGDVNGSNPQTGLVLGANGDLYGTTQSGGTSSEGNIFRITTNGVLTNIYSFDYYDGYGYYPQAALVLGSDGNIYGINQNGGTYGEGNIFKVTTNGLTNFYSFKGETDGYSPQTALLVGSDGSFYGSTPYGGTNYNPNTGRYDGNIFKVTTNGVLTNLFSFTNSNQGELPNTALTQGSDGGFYWTTPYGGEQSLEDKNGYDPNPGNGAVFKLTTNGTLTALYSLNGNGDGAYPQAALVLNTNDGNLYGTASYGGTGYSYGGNGTVFKITTNGAFAMVYAFPGLNDGQNASALVYGGHGSLFATTVTGGTNGGNGTVFSLTSGGALDSLYSFYASYDGENPQAALVQGSDGNFYGTTADLGSNYAGTVFKISPGGALTTLYVFAGGSDGDGPNTALVQGGDGCFYGTTPGTIFKITTNGMLTTLHSFTGGYDGYRPNGLVRGDDGNFYSTTQSGGYGFGNVFSISPGGSFNPGVYLFTNDVDGANPASALTLGFDGNFYGTTSGGGTNHEGNVFEITPSGRFSNIYSFGSLQTNLISSYYEYQYGLDSKLGQFVPTNYTLQYETNSYALDGNSPSQPLWQVADGSFYGTTPSGGIVTNITQNVLTIYTSLSGTNVMTTNVFTTNFSAGGGAGTVFQVKPIMTTNGLSATFSNLYTFSGGVSDGGSPQTSLAQGSDGSLYGSTTTGGVGGYGGLFRLSGASLPSPLPVITVQPVSVTNLLAGLFASFTVTDLGGQPLSYQWQLNNTNLPKGAEFFGTTIPTLKVDPAFASDQGAYSVIVSSPYGVVTSAVATLTTYTASNSAEAYTDGTNYMAQGDQIAANISFSNAIIFNTANVATNAAANATNYLLLAATELLSLPSDPAGSNFLNHLGVGLAGRDIIHFKAKYNKYPVGVNADEITAQLRTNVLAAIIAAQADLAQIVNTNFTAVLTTNETQMGAVTVDYGDVQVLRSMLDTAELLIYTLNGLNLDVQLTTVSNYLSANGSLQTLLAAYPSLLTTASTSDIPAATNAFVTGANQYFAASLFVRTVRPTNGIEPPYLFSVTGTNHLHKEAVFREELTNILASLTSGSPVQLRSNSVYSVSAEAFFSGNFDLRAILPAFQTNEFVWNTLTNTTFDGVLEGLTQQQVGNLLLKHYNTVVNVPGVAVSVLYNFPRFIGQNGVVQGPDGNLYGTTWEGPFTSTSMANSYTNTFPGDDGIVITNIVRYTNMQPNPSYGSFFRITPTGQYSTLFSFGTINGTTIVPYMSASPNALTVGADGNFYGTTQSGGITFVTNIYSGEVQIDVYTNGSGTVFKLTPSGQLTTLYNFGQPADQYASTPTAALVQGVDGNFYGTTQYGGSNGYGTVFQISPSGQFSNLYSFGSVLYTNISGPFTGYKYIFTNGYDVYTNYTYYQTNTYYLDGGYPSTPLVQGVDGNFYGTTQYGGANNSGNFFKITPSGQLTTLYSFDSLLLTNITGPFTNHYEIYNTNKGRYSPDTNILVYYQTNTSPADGVSPNGLVLGPDGNFYGTAQAGGDTNNDGTAFRITPSGVFTKLLSFDENTFDGYAPLGSLVPGFGGAYYGVASAGGANKAGSVYLLNTNNPTQTNITWFGKNSGGYINNLYSYYNSMPSPLVLADDGSYYGTTTDDGVYGNGTVYRLSVSSPPTISKQPGNQTDIAGATVSFVVAASGTPAPAYTWLFNGKPVFNAGGVSGAQTPALTLSNISASEGGSYSVIVSNSVGVVTSSSALLTVLLPPSITTEPVNQLALSNSTAAFSVVAAGTPALSYQWQFDGANIPAATNASLSVTATNGGSYSVIVTNLYGAVTSSIATLTLEEPNVSHPTPSMVTLAITSPTSGGRADNVVKGTATDALFPIWNVLYTVTSLNNGVTSANSGQAVLTLTPGGATWSFTSLLPGENVITVYAIDLAGNKSAVKTLKYFNEVTAPLSVRMPGTGSGHFSVKSFVAGESPTSNALIIGEEYQITAIADAGSVFSGWTVTTPTSTFSTMLSSVKFLMETSLSLTANFENNIYLAGAGTYNGLFAEVTTNGVVDVTEATAGLLGGLVVGTNGNYSGKLWVDGVSKTIGGTFFTASDGTNTYGSATNKVALPGGTVLIEMTMDASTNPPYIYGTVAATNGAWSSMLLAARAANTMPAAQYTMLIPPVANDPATSPAGYGYASITNTAGSAKDVSKATIGGALADGTTFSQSVGVSEDGYVPFYDSLYGNKGLLLGWINLTNNSTGAGLTWIHPATRTGLYKGGFTNTIPASELQLAPWLDTSNALSTVTNSLTNLFIADTINFDDYLFDFGVGYGKKFTLSGVSGNETLTGSLNPKNGLLQVTFGSGKGKHMNGFGAILQNTTNGGGGYFLTPTTGGALQLQGP